MSRPIAITLWWLVACASLLAQTPSAGGIHFDLSKVGFVLDGKQICEDKGRIQDYPSKVMDQIISSGPNAVPVLIAMLRDEHIAETPEPIICYWPPMAIGDIAFCILTDLFTDSTYVKTTLPGTGWDDMLGPPADRPAWVQLNEFIKEHGRTALQVKWQKLWDKYKAEVYWDAKERCFRLRKSK
jgi:hypothetical protein